MWFWESNKDDLCISFCLGLLLLKEFGCNLWPTHHCRKGMSLSELPVEIFAIASGMYSQHSQVFPTSQAVKAALKEALSSMG